VRKRLEPGTRLVVASHNPGKVWEIKELISPYGLDAVSARDLGLREPAETETTFEGNARLKARAAADASGLPALADDSGLEVAALGGAPGVHSADWAGPGRDFAAAMQRVHDELERRKAWGGPPPRANFVSVLCLAWPGGPDRFFRGEVHGHLAWPPRGGNGFGYDPMFVPDGSLLTFGEMEPPQKYAVSHRTRAFEAFRGECLAEAAASPLPASAAGRELEALTAAAANLSTKDELLCFLANLREHTPRLGGGRDFLSRLDAIEDSLAASEPDEPKWRTIAKAVLAAVK
jgi:XTP/dITP diphosphohydrolase